MNEFQLAAINHYIEMNKTFLYLLQNKNFDEESIKLMKQNHDSMRSALIDLGVRFNEIESIRSLNQRIRDMEAAQNSEGINLQKVSTYIENINKKVKAAVEEMGLYAIVNTSFQPNLNIELKLLPSAAKKSSSRNFRTEEEYEEYNNKIIVRHNNFIKNFNTFEDDDEYYLTYDESNITRVKIKLEEILESGVTSFSYEVLPHYQKVDNEKMAYPSIRAIHFNFITLSSHRGLYDAMKDR